MAKPDNDLLVSESRALGELARLQRDPVFWGQGVSRGDGRLVMLLPGLFANDVYLQPMHQWLRRVGYRPVRSTLAVNAGCPDRLREQAENTMRRKLERHPGPVAFVGHSRGGMLAWALASRLRDRASHLALLGSPAPAIVAMFRHGFDPTAVNLAHSSVAAAGQRAMKLLSPDCNVPNCGCPYPSDIRAPLHPSTRVISILSRDDPIVHPNASRLPGGQNVEVGGTHAGLVYNREVYPALAEFLATSS